MRSRVHTVAASAALAAALVAASLDAEAQPLARDNTSCVPPRSAARYGRLSQILRELAAARRFHVQNWSHEDPIVEVGGGSDLQLTEALSGQVNLITRFVAAKNCPGQWRIETIWILPGLPPGSSQTPATAGSPITPSSTQSAKDAAITKRATDMYLRGHGLRKKEPTASPDNRPDGAGHAPAVSSP